MTALRSRWPLLVFVPVSVVLLLLLLQASGSGPAVGGGGRELQAVVPTAVSLSSAADVRIAGLRVGRVSRVVRRGREAVVLMRLDEDAPPVFRDAAVDVRSRTVVGESFVAISPGSAAAGEVPVGETLGPGRAVEATQFDDVASLFDPGTRTRLRGQVDTLATALAGPRAGELNRLVEQASLATGSGAPVLETLADERQAVAALVDHLGTITRALGDRRDDIALLARRGETAVGALARERRAVERLFAAAPAALRQTDATSRRLGALSRRATVPVGDLRRALDTLAPSLSALAPTARAARRAVDELDRFGPGGVRLLRRAGAAADPLRLLLPAMDRALAEANPAIAYLAPYREELGAFFANLGSMTSLGDSLGRLARLAPVVSVSTLATAPKEFLELYDRLKAIGAVGEATGRHGLNPHPAPGTITDPQPFRGRYPRVEAAPVPQR